MLSNPLIGQRSIAALFLVPAAVVTAGTLLALRLHFQPPTVPPYRIAAAGSGTTALRPSDHFELEMQPTEPVTGAVAARGFLLRGNDVRPWEPSFEVARDGSVRLAGSVAALFANVSPGEWEIAVAVGRPETLPTAPKDILRGRGADVDAGVAAWRLLRERIRLGD